MHAVMVRVTDCGGETDFKSSFFQCVPCRLRRILWIAGKLLIGCGAGDGHTVAVRDIIPGHAARFCLACLSSQSVRRLPTTSASDQKVIRCGTSACGVVCHYNRISRLPRSGSSQLHRRLQVAVVQVA